MYFRVLITPDGFRYNQPLGNDLDRTATLARNLRHKAEIIFVFENERVYDGYRDDRELMSIANRLKGNIQKETGADTTGEKIFELIRSTEKEYLDVILDLPDAKDGKEFNIKYGTDLEGALKALNGASSWQVVKSAQKNYVKMLKNDPRFKKLSDEEKERAIKQAKEKDIEARDKDAQKIIQWMERLEQELERRNKQTKQAVDDGGLDDIFNNLEGI